LESYLWDSYQNSYMYRHIKAHSYGLDRTISHNMQKHLIHSDIKKQFENERNVFAKQSNLNLFYLKTTFLHVNLKKLTFKRFCPE